MAKAKEKKRQEAAARQLAYVATFTGQFNVRRAAQDDNQETIDDIKAATLLPLRTPRLIMRAHINRPLGEYAGKIFSEAVDTDYMGNADFEFGKMARSLLVLQSKAAQLLLHAHPTMVDTQGRCLYEMHFLQGEDVALYDAYLSRLRGEGPALRTPEQTKFEKGASQSSLNLIDLWWDLENHVFWSFDRDFMIRLRECLDASWAYMDAERRDAA